MLPTTIAAAHTNSTTIDAESVTPAREWWRVARAKDTATVSARTLGLENWTYFVPNTNRSTWVIVADIDHADGDLRAWSCPAAPSWVIVNPQSGHAQAGWIIEPVSHGPRAREKPQQYLEAVESALRAEVGSDARFTAGRCRNPFYLAASVRWGHAQPRSLGTLKASLVEAGAWKPTNQLASTDSGSNAQPACAHARAILPGERNVTVFEVARRAHNVEEAAHAANDLCSPPLPEAEIKHIVASIERYRARQGIPTRSTQRVSDTHRQWQSERGRRGGSRHTPAQRAGLAQGTHAAAQVRRTEAMMRRQHIVDQAAPLLDQGHSQRAVAAELGIPESTLRTALTHCSPSAQAPEHSGNRPAHTLSPTPAPTYSAPRSTPLSPVQPQRQHAPQRPSPHVPPRLRIRLRPRPGDGWPRDVR